MAKITKHGQKRMKERVNIKNKYSMEKMANKALEKGEVITLCFDGRYSLLYQNYLFWFSKDILITVIKKEPKRQHKKVMIDKLCNDEYRRDLHRLGLAG